MINKLKADHKAARFARDEVTKRAVESVLSAVDKQRGKIGRELTNDEVINVIKKQVGEFQEANVYLIKAGREERRDAEIAVLETYLPETMNSTELLQFMGDIINEYPVNHTGDMIKFLNQAGYKGKFDNKMVNQLMQEFK